MHIIENMFIDVLCTKVRDKETTTEELQATMIKLGEKLAEEILSEYFTVSKPVNTPMDNPYIGKGINDDKIVVITTKDDYKYLGSGFENVFPNISRGFMDFGGKRGAEISRNSIRDIYLPNETDVDTLIVAKSVVATGCTAIYLIKQAIEEYNPKNIIVVAPFYSARGIKELEDAIKDVNVFVVREADGINSKGMLVPGVGDLDKRLNAS